MLSENIALYAFQKFGDAALQAAYCCLGNRADAEDVTQDVFFALHKHPRSFNDDEHLKAYVLRAVINRCNSLHRKLKRQIRIGLDTVIENLTSSQDNAGEIIRMIRSLPAPYNAVVYLHDCEGYTIREIAEMLDRKENTVSAQLRRGREKLKIEITESGVLK